MSSSALQRSPSAARPAGAPLPHTKPTRPCSWHAALPDGSKPPNIGLCPQPTRTECYKQRTQHTLPTFEYLRPSPSQLLLLTQHLLAHRSQGQVSPTWNPELLKNFLYSMCPILHCAQDEQTRSQVHLPPSLCEHRALVPDTQRQSISTSGIGFH